MGGQGCIPFGILGENLLLQLFQLLEGTSFPRLVAPNSVFKVSSVASSILFLTLTLLPPSYEDPDD